MPGILPMKMIRVGSNSQSRIAQACDRCRSKKIRCDGIRPCCSQCANVGFECKTSDKLSRRAFPRGYTESLEDRVRGLEAEVRELKDLLDEKDEKIDMLSRIHSFSPMRKNSASLSPPNSGQLKTELASTEEEVLHVEIPASVQPSSTSAGTSTTAAFMEAFEERVQEQGHACPVIAPAALLAPASSQARSPASSNASAAPPRLLSDQYINLFFQEWQPLMPILHRQTFLRLYEQYLASPDALSLQGSKLAVAQLFLIFEIAAHSSSSKARPNTTAYELQWRKALSATSSIPSLAVLQCHILAQLCYLLKADYPHLLRHRGYAVSICHQLGLHQGHKISALPTFEAELRKRAFWCQYVLDKFASATTGMPMLLRDSDITAEFPADVDDENITEQGFSPALPGELTKISSALALFRMSKILAKTLEHLYPAGASYAISLKKLHSLSDELDQWHEELPDHLRLRFCNDKPATHLISDRSPLLSLAYFHTRSLIHRPLLCYGSGSAASAATIVLAAAAKHILQIIDLLDERCMNYTFPVNKQDILLNAGTSILWQCIDLDDDSKIIKDNQKSLSLLLTKAAKENVSASNEFQKIASSFVVVGSPRVLPPHQLPAEAPPARLLNTMPAPANNKQKSTRKQLQAIASRFSGFSTKDNNNGDSSKRRTVSPRSGSTTIDVNPPRANSTISLVSTQSAPAPATQLSTTPSPRTTHPPRLPGQASSVVNLDYFPFDGSLHIVPSHNSSSTMLPPKKHSLPTHSSWEHLVQGFDHQSVLYNTVEPNALNKTTSNPEILDWTGELWNLGGFHSEKPNVPQSLLSFPEESLASADDFVFSTAGSHNGSMSTNDGLDLSAEESFKGITMPVSSIEDELDFSPAVHA
ncbi:DNA-binding transcription factor cat8 [Lithohypha guttulata]|uniref:DNA-binding transcription factor cat8 n=1 Tax=Lithohypha guttulata TaxID=1690604 RepID=A0AAN7T146_9EURO|nr:DNA-binding transcription factor cat8 [Lithohypha guttulata]